MRLDCVPFSVVVNRDVERFYDEGEDVWPKRYAIWGRLIAQQPDQVAFAINDSKAQHNYLPPVFAPYEAASIAELAGMIGLDAGKLEKVVADYNAAVQPGTFSAQTLDDCRTEGLNAAEIALGAAHRYAALLLPPAAAGHHLHLPLGEGGTDRARVMMADGKPSANMFASGEIMSGRFLGQGDISPGSAWRSAPSSAASPARKRPSW